MASNRKPPEPMPMELRETPHRRYNPLLREWVLVSPHRTQRPWQGKVHDASAQAQPKYDPDCYLCPGNARAGGARNPDYQSTLVFDNDFAALLPSPVDAQVELDGLIVARAERGICRVVCFDPRHDLTIGSMGLQQIRRVIDVWVEQYVELGSLPWINHVQIFENRGALMGASNPHPHCQIWANAGLPNLPLREQESMEQYSTTHNACMLCSYLALERKAAERIVCENDAFVALVPFWAVWPFEVMVLSSRHLGGMDELSEKERDLLSDILQQVTAGYDRVFEVSFPYSMGFHQRPTDGKNHPEWHLHAHYYPPLLRSATVQKFMVGYEMLSSPQRDITPEIAAGRLRETARATALERQTKSETILR
jgi:UDPglucose--hexose-1-phosphate uridylyltransferase